MSSRLLQEAETRRPSQTEADVRGSIRLLRLPPLLQPLHGGGEEARSAFGVRRGRPVGRRAGPALAAAAGFPQEPQGLGGGVRLRRQDGLAAPQEGGPVLLAEAEEEAGVGERGEGAGGAEGDQDDPQQPAEQRSGQRFTHSSASWSFKVKTQYVVYENLCNFFGPP